MLQLNALRDSKAIENLIYIQVLICLILDLSKDFWVLGSWKELSVNSNPHSSQISLEEDFSQKY